jgi:hypothetical protein
MLSCLLLLALWAPAEPPVEIGHWLPDGRWTIATGREVKDVRESVLFTAEYAPPGDGRAFRTRWRNFRHARDLPLYTVIETGEVAASERVWLLPTMAEAHAIRPIRRRPTGSTYVNAWRRPMPVLRGDWPNSEGGILRIRRASEAMRARLKVAHDTPVHTQDLLDGTGRSIGWQVITVVPLRKNRPHTLLVRDGERPFRYPSPIRSALRPIVHFRWQGRRYLLVGGFDREQYYSLFELANSPRLIWERTQ